VSLGDNASPVGTGPLQLALGPGPGAGGTPTELFETLTSTILLVGEVAIKWKKPVHLDFLDFESVESRRAACEREVELNRRLAPDVYLGVAEVEWPHLASPEPLVVMRRLPSECRLSTLAARGAVTGDELEALARLLSEFHIASSHAGPVARAAEPDAVLGRWEQNAEVLSSSSTDESTLALSDAVLAQARAYVAGRRLLFFDRAERGKSCDGHGDLLADDIYLLEDGPRVLDCLDFDDGLRWGDVVADVAFLAMDLEHRGHAELAASFLDAYQRQSGEQWPASLLHHYVAYRAQVRAKVAQLRSVQGRSADAEEARALLQLAERHLRRAVPALVLIGGLPGSGKSTVADALAPSLDARVLRTDEVRSLVVGPRRAPRVPLGFGEWPYRTADRDATYTALLGAARSELTSGHSVVLDATFTSMRWRAAARQLAVDAHAAYGALHCRAPLAVLEQRLEHRPPGPSEATADVAFELARREEPWVDAPTLDGSRSRRGTAAAARTMLETQLGLRLDETPEPATSLSREVGAPES
jgi:uncharacterized protein